MVPESDLFHNQKIILDKKQNVWYPKNNLYCRIGREEASVLSYCMEYAQYRAVPDTEKYHPCSTKGSPLQPIMHTHDCYEICLIRKGDFSIISQDVCCRQQGPCMIVYNYECPHAQFDSRTTEYERFCLHLWPPVASLLSHLYQIFIFNITKSAVVIPLSEERINWLYQICSRIFHFSETRGISCEEECSLIPLRCLMMEINNIIQTETVSRSHQNIKIMEAMTYINQHLTEKLSLENIAEYLQISKTKLCTDFQKYASMSVHQYIIRERLSLAQQYLSGEHSIERIAELCCFGTASHFVCTFQKYFSVTPAQYRAAHKNKK